MGSANIRFFDSESSLVWDDLSSNRAFNLIPVDDIHSDQLTGELTALRRIYASEPPYVFLHVCTTEVETDGIVVWAIRRPGEWALIYAAASAPVADTIAAIALALPVQALFFAWDSRRISLIKHFLLRFIGRRTAVPLDTMWLMRRSVNGREPPKVLIRHAP